MSHQDLNECRHIQMGFYAVHRKMKRLHHQNKKQRAVKFLSFFNQLVTSFSHCRYYRWHLCKWSAINRTWKYSPRDIHQHVLKHPSPVFFLHWTLRSDWYQFLFSCAEPTYRKSNEVPGHGGVIWCLYWCIYVFH